MPGLPPEKHACARHRVPQAILLLATAEERAVPAIILIALCPSGVSLPRAGVKGATDCRSSETCDPHLPTAELSPRSEHSMGIRMGIPGDIERCNFQ